MAKTLREAYVPIPGITTKGTPRTQGELNKARKKTKRNPNVVATGIGSLVNRGDTIADLIKQGKGK